MMVPVLHEKQECKVEKLKYKNDGGHAAEDETQIQTSSAWINHPGSVHTNFCGQDWLIQSIIYKRRKIRGRGGEGGLKERGAYQLSSLEKGGAYWSKGACLLRRGLNREFMVNVRVLEETLTFMYSNYKLITKTPKRNSGLTRITFFN